MPTYAFGRGNMKRRKRKQGENWKEKGRKRGKMKING
jgi:hypothetical protein